MKKISIIIVALSLLLASCHEPEIPPSPICPMIGVDANGNELLR